MSELLNSSGLHSSTGTSTSNNLLSISDNTPVPQYTSMPMSESQAASLPPQTGTQGSALDESQARSDLFNVLANLQQNSVELGVLLQQQPHLLHGEHLFCVIVLAMTFELINPSPTNNISY